MGHVIGVMVHVLLLAGLLASMVWILYTKKAVQKAGITRFLIATIVWNGVLFGVYILVWKLSSLPVVFYLSPSGWLSSVCGIIYFAYFILMKYVFPAYTALLIIYAGYHTIRKGKYDQA